MPRREQVQPHLVIKTPGYSNALAYLPDGRRIVTNCTNGVTILNADNGIEEGTLTVNHLDRLDSVFRLAVIQDGKTIICSTEKGNIKVCDIELNEIVKEWEYPPFSQLAISPDNQFIAVGSEAVFIHAIKGWQVTQVIEVGERVWSMAFSPAGDKLACGTLNGDVLVYDVAFGTLLLGPLTSHAKRRTYLDRVTCVLWSCDGKKLFASMRKTICCWDADTGEQIGHPWMGHTSRIYSLTLSPYGSILVSTSHDSFCFWDASTGVLLGQPLRHGASVETLCFSPSGEFIASRMLDTVYVWRAPVFNTLNSPITSTAFFDVHNPHLQRVLPPPYSPQLSNGEHSLEDDVSLHRTMSSILSQAPSATFVPLPAPQQETTVVCGASETISNEVALNSILPSRALAPTDRQRIFELRLRSLVEQAMLGGLIVTPEFLRSLLPMNARNELLTTSGNVADISPTNAGAIEASMSILHPTPSDNSRKICKIDRIKQKLIEMLHEIGFNLPKGRLPWFTLEADLEKKGYRMVHWPQGVVRYKDKGISGLSAEDADKLYNALFRDDHRLEFIRGCDDIDGSNSSVNRSDEDGIDPGAGPVIQTGSRRPRFRAVITAETFVDRPNKRRRV